MGGCHSIPFSRVPHDFLVESMYQSFNDESLPAQIRGKETLGNHTPNFRFFEVSHYTLLLRWPILIKTLWPHVPWCRGMKISMNFAVVVDGDP